MKKYLLLLLASLCILSNLSAMESKLICLDESGELTDTVEVDPDLRIWCKTIMHMSADFEGKEGEADAFPVMIPATSLTLLKEFHVGKSDTQATFLQEKSIEELAVLFKAMNFLDYKNPDKFSDRYGKQRLVIGHLAQNLFNDPKENFKKIHELGLDGDHGVIVADELKRIVKPLLIDYSLLNGKSISQKKISDKVDEKTCIFLMPDNRTLLIGSNNVVQVWDLEKEMFMPELTCELGPITVLSASQDSKTILMGSKNNAMLLDIETKACLHTLACAGEIKVACFSADGSTVFIGATKIKYHHSSGRSENNTPGETEVILWNTATGESKRVFSKEVGKLASLAVDDGLNIFLGTTMNGRGYLKIYDLFANEEGRQAKVGAWPRVCVMPDSKRIVTGGFDGKIAIFDLESGDLSKSIDGHSAWPILSVSTTLDGSKVITSSRNCTKIWHGETGNCLREIKLWNLLDRDFIRSICVSADGSTLVAKGAKTIKILNLCGSKFEESVKELTLRQLLLVCFGLKHNKEARDYLASSDSIELINSLDPLFKELFIEPAKRCIIS